MGSSSVALGRRRACPVPGADRLASYSAVTLFGVSAAGYRNEGSVNGPGLPANQWAVWEWTGLAPVPTPGCELWRDPVAALDRAASSGAEAVMLGVEWARVEPGPDAPDARALDRYAHILGLCAERGMLPLVVLHDVAHPEWLGEEFWLTPGSPDRFRAHVERVHRAIGGLCRHWVTVRQPNLVALAGWVLGRQPPRRYGAAKDAWAVLDNLLSAHVLAHDAIHSADAGASPVVIMGLRASTVYDWSRLAVDLLVADGAGVDAGTADRWVDARRARHDAAQPPRDLVELAARRAAVLTSAYGRRAAARSPRRVLDLVARRGAPTPPLDALLVVWRAPQLGAVPAPRSRRRHAPAPRPPAVPGPGELGGWLRDQRDLTPGVGLWVEDGAPPGVDRPCYLRRSVDEICPLDEGGVPVDGYLYHSLAGSGEPTRPDLDYGLFAVRAAPGGEGVVWSDEDGNGAASAAAFRRLVAERCAGER
jgi:hypothetical protein